MRSAAATGRRRRGRRLLPDRRLAAPQRADHRGRRIRRHPVPVRGRHLPQLVQAQRPELDVRDRLRRRGTGRADRRHHGAGRTSLSAGRGLTRCVAPGPGLWLEMHAWVHDERMTGPSRAADRGRAWARRNDLRAGWSSRSRGSMCAFGAATASLVPLPLRSDSWTEGIGHPACPRCLGWDRSRAGRSARGVVTTLVRVRESARLVSAADTQPQGGLCRGRTGHAGRVVSLHGDLRPQAGRLSGDCAADRVDRRDRDGLGRCSAANPGLVCHVPRQYQSL